MLITLKLWFSRPPFLNLNIVWTISCWEISRDPTLVLRILLTNNLLLICLSLYLEDSIFIISLKLTDPYSGFSWYLSMYFKSISSIMTTRISWLPRCNKRQNKEYWLVKPDSESLIGVTIAFTFVWPFLFVYSSYVILVNNWGYCSNRLVRNSTCTL